LADDLKLSAAGLRLVSLFVQYPAKRWSGTEITKVTKIGSGTLYPLLAKLEAAKWLTPEWENIDPSEEGRPRRRYYKLTAIGARRAHNALAEFQIGALPAGRLAWNT
jgi:PadR family transcriptional regulator, regulatory protein PadR